MIGFVEHLHATGVEIRGEVARVLRDGGLVLVHSLANPGQGDLAIFDLFRFEDGIAVEHWDVIQPHPEETVSGRPMVDGTTEIVDLILTEANRALFTDFVTSVVMNGRFERIPEFIGEPYLQHNPKIGDGIQRVFAYAGQLAEEGITFSYDRLHRTIAEGNFVLAQREGQFDGTPTAFYDLYRIENGMIVEHWDVIQAIPDKMPHDNGML